MAKKKILITVKTYPTLSKSYDELVCTAGLAENGDWYRIYPIPFRKLEYDTRYKKYQWIEVDLERNRSDPRPESYKVKNFNNITIGDSIPTDPKKPHWPERRDLTLKKVYCNTTEIIELANANKMSLATFKPKKFLDFEIEEQESRTWDENTLRGLEAAAQQTDLFHGGENPFRVVDKLPYKFYYHFEDCKGKRSRLMIEDWEIGALYRKCMESYRGDEDMVKKKIREKYWDLFVEERDLYLFLGTTRARHGRARNPYIIIGVFYPGKLPSQQELF